MALEAEAARLIETFSKPLKLLVMRARLSLICALSLALSACGGGDTELSEVQDTGERDRIRAWMTAFDKEYADGVKAYGIGNWMLPGDNVDSVDMGQQVLTNVICENVATASQAQPSSSGGYLAQVRALWLYTVGGCAGPNSQAQAQALAALESARRKMNTQWENELAALPGSVRIQIKAGKRAKQINPALLLAANEYTSCLADTAGRYRVGGFDLSFAHANIQCSNHSQSMARYAICPISWQVIAAHQAADQAGFERDEQAWLGDATARFRMAWRACDANALNHWQAYLPQIPRELREGKLRRISAPADPLMACQFTHFRRMLAIHGPNTSAQTDDRVINWCTRQFGLQYMGHFLAPPKVFTTQIINDTGPVVSWLYDPAKANQRPHEWKMTQCMTQVAQKMANEGFNVPSPTSLRQYCGVDNGLMARKYLSGEALVEGRNLAGPPPE